VINQVCNPDDKVSLEEHKHICPRCNTCWKHRDDVQDSTAEAFYEAHECPKCGLKNVTKKLFDDQQLEKALCALLGFLERRR
jgi:ribosomal protein S27AE